MRGKSKQSVELPYVVGLTRRDVAIAAALAVFAFALYAQTASFSFINYDDNDYVTDNAMVQRGFGWALGRWAFTTGYASHWHPLTWLSHGLDFSLFGLNPVGHHLTSTFWHAVNTALLFLALRRLTGELGLSACVAVLFAVHPMNVQSVAWIAERKNVLSTFFGLLCIHFYAGYARQPSLSRYVLVFITLGFGLMSKAMLVTWPCVLLLLDWWPLRRVDLASPGTQGKRVVLEKIPLFGLVIFISVGAYFAMRAFGAVGSAEKYTILVRVENAIVSYGTYLLRLIAPFNLSPFYPHALGAVPIWKVALSAAVLIGITVFAIMSIKRRPYIAFGWLWYLGTLVPVIGLVQVGDQAMGDRYAYVPYVGLFVAVVWGIRELARAYAVPNRAVGSVFAVVLALFVVRTLHESRNWKDDIALWEHAAAVTEDNYVAHQNLGVAYRMAKRNDEALQQFQEALRIRPNHTRSMVNVGTLYLERNQNAEALQFLEKAVEVEPSDAMAQVSLGMAYSKVGEHGKAIEHLEEGFRRSPLDYRIANLTGTLLAQQGKHGEAAEYFREALRINPNYEKAKRNLELLPK